MRNVGHEVAIYAALQQSYLPAGPLATEFVFKRNVEMSEAPVLSMDRAGKSRASAVAPSRFETSPTEEPSAAGVAVPVVSRAMGV